MRRLLYGIAKIARLIARRTGRVRRGASEPKRVVLLVVATNKYLNLVEPLLASADKHFLPGHYYEVVLFTNLEADPQCLQLVSRRAGRARGRVTVRHVEHEPWPMMTLLRYRFFTQAAATIHGYDFAFYSDCDMRFVADVGDEILGDGLTAVMHCGFFNKHRRCFTYEIRPESRAYIPPDSGECYFAGGFQGGTAKAYVHAAAECAKQIDDDLSRGITATWHDESHWNAFLCRNHLGVTILDPGYCLGEKMRAPYPAMILALDKNHAHMRSEG